MKFIAFVVCACALVSFLPAQEWQVNTLAAHLDHNDIQAQANGPGASLAVPAGLILTLNVMSTNVGMPYEIAFTPFAVAPVSGGALLLPASGQIVHINPLWPGTVFWSTAGPLANPLDFTGNFSVPFTATFPTSGSAQMLIIDPTNPDGAALSQASHVEFTL